MPDIIDNIGKIENISLTDEMQKSYLDYAMSVIVSRALPDVRDGLKPVQRRIIYAMQQQGLHHTSRYQKSAAVVGEVLKNFHPHGDVAVYDAMVRMAQNFSLRYPLVDGQGNFGCFTKDTKILLTDGRSLSFEELIREQQTGKRHWTFSYSLQDKRIKIAEIHKPRLTIKQASLVEVTLDNGEKIRCTPNHRFLLRSGSYREAENLKPSDSLMPLYTTLDTGEDDKNLKDYSLVMQPANNQWEPVHHLSDEWNIENKIYDRKAGKIRHHIDFDKHNNNPNNIKRMQWADHWKLHAQLASWRHLHDASYREKLALGRNKYIHEHREVLAKRRSELNQLNWKNPEYRETQISRIKRMWEDEQYKDVKRKEASERLRKLWKDPTFNKSVSLKKSNELKQKWQDTDYQQKIAEQTRVLSLLRWSDPQYKAKISAKITAQANKPENKKRQSMRAKDLWEDINYRAKFGTEHFSQMAKVLWSKEDTKKLHSDKAKRQWQYKEFRKSVTKAVSESNKQRIQKNPQIMHELAMKAAESLRSNWQDEQYKKKVIQSKTLRYVSQLQVKNLEVTPKLYEEERRNNGTPKLENALKYFTDFNEILTQAQSYNHKVLEVRTLDTREDVYDLTIEKYHNFALASGVIVHNSVDGDSPAAMRYCVTGDTLVITNRGLQKIKDLSPNNSEELTCSVLSFNRKINKTSKWFDSGIHPTIKVTTKQGLSIQGTHNHPLLTWTKNPLTGKPEYRWKLLEQISLGDIVVIDRSESELWPTKPVALDRFAPKTMSKRVEVKLLPKYLNKSLSYILGALLAEGTIATDKIEFCNSDEQWIIDFETAWKKVFPDCRLHKFAKQPSSYGKKPYYRLEIHSLYIIKFLENIGLNPARAKDKQIPQLVFQSPKAVVAEFLKAYFEGDGRISSSGKMTELSAISVSEQLISDLHILLLRFGIAGTKRYDKYRSNHKLYIRGLKNYQLYQQGIGFLSQRKQTKLQNIITKSVRDQSMLDYVPYLREYVLNNLDMNLRYAQREYALKHNFDRYNNLALNYQQTSNLVIPQLKRETQQLFEDLITNNYLFDSIIAIEDGGLQQVYSVKVESKCHSFVGNGFVNHNTEARLSAIADELLRDINKDTVDFADNYSGTTQEPTLLPAVIPNLLLNGAAGIAVGMATQIPPHNLGEVTDALIHMIEHPMKEALVKKVEEIKDESIAENVDGTTPVGTPDITPTIPADNISTQNTGFKSDVTVEDLMKFIKGPDFPTGASIYDQTEIAAAYATGKGRVVMRAKAEIEETKAGRFDIIVTEIPFQVNKAVLIGRIADLVRDKKIEGIADLRDESDRKGMRIVIELKRDAKPQSVLNNLYKHTAMQSVFNVNMVALSDGVPHLMTLKRILEEFIHHRQVVVIRRSEFELAEARAREHILEGLKIAVDNIDEVINTIRRSKDSDEARVNLMSKFKLTEIQATAILDMQLRRLAALERQKIEDELKMIRETIDYLEDLLAHPEKILKVIKDELMKVRDRYADERRTRVYKQKVGEFSEEDLVADEVAVVTVTEGGYVKRQLPASFRTQARGGKGVSGITTKMEDAVSHIFYCKTLDNLLFFTDRGRVFQIKVWEIPETSRVAKGQAIVNLINVDQGEKITAILTHRAKDVVKYLFMGTKMGSVKKTPIEEYANIRKNGLISIKLDSGDLLRWVVPTTGEHDVIIVSRLGQSIRINEKQVKPTHRDTSGVRGILLGKNDDVVSLNLVKDAHNELLTVMKNGLGKKTRVDAWKIQNRGGSGIKAAQITEKTGEIVTAEIVDSNSDTLVMTSNKGQLIRIHIKDVPTLQRQTQGVILMRTRPGESVAAAAVVSSNDQAGNEAAIEGASLEK